MSKDKNDLPILLKHLFLYRSLFCGPEKGIDNTRDGVDHLEVLRIVVTSVPSIFG